MTIPEQLLAMARERHPHARRWYSVINTGTKAGTKAARCNICGLHVAIWDTTPPHRLMPKYAERAITDHYRQHWRRLEAEAKADLTTS